MDQTLDIPTSLDSLTHILALRQLVLDMVRQAHQAEYQAHQALTKLGLTSCFKVSHQGRSINTTLSDDGLARELGLDRDIWLVLQRRVMGQVQTSQQRQAQEKALYDGDYPPVRPETILETLRGYQASAEEAFIQSVYDLWRSLHRRYKSNDAPCFGVKQVLSFVCEKHHFSEKVHLTRYGIGHLRDLVQIIGVYQKQGMDFGLHSVPEHWHSEYVDSGTWLEFGAFKIKLFKNGNMHLMMCAPLIDVLNKTLASAAGKRLHKAA